LVLKAARYDTSSEGDTWRLNAAMDILRERRKTEFNAGNEKEVSVADV
jgi:hypothetical protein